MKRNLIFGLSLLGVLATCLFLRLFCLDEVMPPDLHQFDGATSSYSSSLNGFFRELLHKDGYDDICWKPVKYAKPPVYYLTLGVWAKMLGFSLYKAKLLSVLFGIGVAVFTFLSLKEAHSRLAAVVAATLVSLSSVMVFASRYVREDIALAFFMSGAVYFTIMLAKEKRLRWYFLAGFFSATALFTHFLGVYVMFPVFATILFVNGARTFKSPGAWLALAPFPLFAALYIGATATGAHISGDSLSLSGFFDWAWTLFSGLIANGHPKNGFFYESNIVNVFALTCVRGFHWHFFSTDNGFFRIALLAVMGFWRNLLFLGFFYLLFKVPLFYIFSLARRDSGLGRYLLSNAKIELVFWLFLLFTAASYATNPFKHIFTYFPIYTLPPILGASVMLGDLFKLLARPPWPGGSPLPFNLHVDRMSVFLSTMTATMAFYFIARCSFSPLKSLVSLLAAAAISFAVLTYSGRISSFLSCWRRTVCVLLLAPVVAGLALSFVVEAVVIYGVAERDSHRETADRLKLHVQPGDVITGRFEWFDFPGHRFFHQVNESEADIVFRDSSYSGNLSLDGDKSFRLVETVNGTEVYYNVGKNPGRKPPQGLLNEEAPAKEENPPPPRN